MEKLFYNGDIITMEGECENANAVLIEDGLIKAVDRTLAFKSLLTNNKIEKVDLEGKTLMPAFIDPHSHISLVAQTQIMADLAACRSFEDIKKELIKYINENIENNNRKNNEIVFAFGYDHNFLKENKHPRKDLLDEVSAEIPIIILHKSLHMGVANTQALEVLNIDESTENPEGGVIGRIENSNEPNGYLEESPIINLLDDIPEYANFDILELSKKAQDVYAENGITTVQDGAAGKASIESFFELAKNEELFLDVISYPLVSSDAIDFIKGKKYEKNYYNNFKIGGYKLILDGSPQGKTAWLTESYEGEESYSGNPWYEDYEVKEYISKTINNNRQLLTHCNGDAAIDQLLRNYELVLKESDNLNKTNLRPVIIHCQIVREDQLNKMVDLDMIPSMFAAHTYYWGDIHLKNLGSKRANKIDPANSALARNLVLNFHQDAPIVKSNMLHTIWSAVNRLSRKGKVIGERERITVYDALKAVTINAAYQYHEEGIKGSIKEGKLADLVILDKNPLEVDEMEIKDIEVLETIKEGKTIYKL
ncbi:MAG: amidohydrolase [Bacillota bacterium]